MSLHHVITLSVMDHRSFQITGFVSGSFHTDMVILPFFKFDPNIINLVYKRCLKSKLEVCSDHKGNRDKWLFTGVQ